MNTKLLMTASSVFMGLIGMALIFMPDETLKTLGQEPNNTLNLILQLTGALYFGFAVTNWMAKTVLIGGIYARPLSIGNFSHFLIAGLALIKVSMNTVSANTYTYVLTFLYIAFAILFGYVFVTHPKQKQST
ncbi:MAG TPA: hypothetical protein PLL71_02330 [Agriterribacter sp.]|nr:hypothetical protein [Agriterribacter sp.]HRQ49953.1 hypothetical protein [Agriterribacter sp.]